MCKPLLFSILSGGSHCVKLSAGEFALRTVFFSFHEALTLALISFFSTSITHSIIVHETRMLFECKRFDFVFHLLLKIYLNAKILFTHKSFECFSFTAHKQLTGLLLLFLNQPKGATYVQLLKVTMIHGIISALIVVTVFILYMEIRKWHIKKQLKYFESPKQYPIIGIAGRFFGKPNNQIIETILHVFDEVKSTPIQAWFGPVLGVGI